MAQARRKSSGGRKRRSKAWLLLLAGVAVGVGGVYLWQLVSKRVESKSGIGSLLTSSKPAEKATDSAKAETAPQEKDPKKEQKLKYEFYRLLQNESVVAYREAPPEKTAKTAKPEEGVSYALQVGAFGAFADADQLKAKLALLGMQAQIQKAEIEGKTYYRVRLGPFAKLEQLDAPTAQLKLHGIKAIPVKIRKPAGHG